MKRITLLLIAAGFTMTSAAQSSKLVSARNYLNDYSRDNKDIESLNKAKEYIDQVVVHPDTKDMAKAHTLKAQIYLTLFDYSLRTESEKLNSTVPDPNK